MVLRNQGQGFEVTSIGDGRFSFSASTASSIYARFLLLQTRRSQKLAAILTLGLSSTYISSAIAIGKCCYRRCLEGMADNGGRVYGVYGATKQCSLLFAQVLHGSTLVGRG